MTKQINISGIIYCPECNFGNKIIDYKNIKEGVYFAHRCDTCGHVFEIKWERRDVISIKEK